MPPKNAGIGPISIPMLVLSATLNVSVAMTRDQYQSSVHSVYETPYNKLY